jgi:hypothetical protein
MQDTFFLIGYILAISLIATIVYRVKVWGFKSYFHGITHDIIEDVSREKIIFYKINSYCFVLSALLAPIILLAYPSFVDRFPDYFQTSENFLLHLIATTIYIAAMLAGFYHLIHVLIEIWKSRKDKKRFN